MQVPILRWYHEAHQGNRRLFTNVHEKSEKSEKL